jgi:hypothetical protein
MQKAIVWNISALSDYHDNIDYLLREWSETEALHFMDDVENIIFCNSVIGMLVTMSNQPEKWS